MGAPSKKRHKGHSVRRGRTGSPTPRPPAVVAATAPPVGRTVPLQTIPPATVEDLRELRARYDGPVNTADVLATAQLMASAWEAVPAIYRRQPGNCWALLQYARALDVAVGTALQNLFFNSDGTVGMRGALMWALVTRAGHRFEEVHRSATKVTLRLVRCDAQPSGEATWTLAEAQRLNLTARSSWRESPGAPTMLFWRTVARVCREYAPEVLLGFGYLPDELASNGVPAGADEAGERPVDADVQALLADMELRDEAGLIDLAQLAKKAGLLERYAGTVDGQEYTVGTLLAIIAERRSSAQPAADEPAPAVAADAVGALPAGLGVLPCGCDATAMLATGEHGQTCTAGVFEDAWSS